MIAYVIQFLNSLKDDEMYNKKIKSFTSSNNKDTAPLRNIE